MNLWHPHTLRQISARKPSLNCASRRKAKSSQNEVTLYKYYKNVEIQNDDTLWDLAKENYCKNKQSIKEYMNEVKSINHLTDDSIVAGNYLVLPYYSETFVYN